MHQLVRIDKETGNEVETPAKIEEKDIKHKMEKILQRNREEVPQILQPLIAEPRSKSTENETTGKEGEKLKAFNQIKEKHALIMSM